MHGVTKINRELTHAAILPLTSLAPEGRSRDTAAIASLRTGLRNKRDLR
jgi:hypothetical protein